MDNFESDYQFILNHHFYEPNRDYIADNKRFLRIIETYEDIDSPYGKYAWLVGHAYYYLKSACYRTGVIRNLEKYLTLKPFIEDYPNTYISPEHNSAITLPRTKKDFILAEKTHFKTVYFLLGRTCEKENLLEKAFFYLQKGREVIPEEQTLFFVELYEVYRKMNNLPQFIQECENLPVKQQSDHINCLKGMAQGLINRNYVYKPRKKRS